MGIDRLRWVHIDAWAKREAQTRQKAPKVGEQEVLLSCLMTAVLNPGLCADRILDF